jgi:hypothetical protein
VVVFTFLSSQGSIEMALHIPVEEIFYYYEQFQNPEIEHLRGGASTSETRVFWDDINRLCVRGRLEDAWSLLQLHSEIRSVVEFTSSATERQAVERIRDLFLTHPSRLTDKFFELYDGVIRSAELRTTKKIGNISVIDDLSVEEEKEIAEYFQFFASTWITWRESVLRIRNDPTTSQLLGKLPQMQTLIQVMSGDLLAITTMSKKYGAALDSDRSSLWYSYALCRLIYGSVTPPPFPKSLVESILKDGMNMENDIISSNNINFHSFGLILEVC